ncbi:hypothetical protein B0H13DRAFT_2364948 [Mycena leptocephala]|nr:hypothetical protein B0H13DRAFT_2364948 [Mycena leptocephala]
MPTDGCAGVRVAFACAAPVAHIVTRSLLFIPQHDLTIHIQPTFSFAKFHVCFPASLLSTCGFLDIVSRGSDGPHVMMQSSPTCLPVSVGPLTHLIIFIAIVAGLILLPIVLLILLCRRQKCVVW